MEAYEECEPAAHTYAGPTPRNQVMFGRAGLLYTYFTYGMHWCANVVVGEPGHGQAVLLRAAQPLAGQEVFRRRRGDRIPQRDLLRGPARLAQAFGLNRESGGMDLLASDSPVKLLGRDGPRPVITSGPRVGVRLAADLPWRHWIADNAFVSSYRRHPRAGQYQEG